MVNFFVKFLSEPTVVLGLVAMIGLIAMKNRPSTVIQGTMKTMLGFLILSAGSSLITLRFLRKSIISFCCYRLWCRCCKEILRRLWNPAKIWKNCRIRRKREHFIIISGWQLLTCILES